jgi:hypothetical protein
MAIFSAVGEKILDFNKLIDPSVAASYLNDLRPIAATVLAIFLIWRVIQIMMGSNKKPVADVAIEVMVWAIIWGFVFTSSYLNWVQNGITEVYNYFGGGIKFFNNLDNWWENLYKAGEILYEKDDNYVPFRGALALFIVLLASFILNMIPLFIVLVSSLIINVLVALAPFMILALIFPSLRKTFYNWVELLLTIFLVVLIISIIQKSLTPIIDKFTNNIIATANASTAGSVTGEAFEVLIVCAVYAILFLITVPIAKSIGGASHHFGVGKH